MPTHCHFHWHLPKQYISFNSASLQQKLRCEDRNWPKDIHFVSSSSPQRRKLPSLHENFLYCRNKKEMQLEKWTETLQHSENVTTPTFVQNKLAWQLPTVNCSPTVLLTRDDTKYCTLPEQFRNVQTPQHRRTQLGILPFHVIYTRSNLLTKWVTKGSSNTRLNCIRSQQHDHWVFSVRLMLINRVQLSPQWQLFLWQTHTTSLLRRSWKKTFCSAHLPNWPPDLLKYLLKSIRSSSCERWGLAWWLLTLDKILKRRFDCLRKLWKVKRL